MHIRVITIVLLGFFIPAIAWGQSENSADRYRDIYKQYLSAECPIKEDGIKHFVYFARDRELIHDHIFLDIEKFEGAQIMYSWKQLEPKKGEYDFSIIKEDYDYLLSHGKKLFIQLQDATFNPEYIAVPDYLRSEAYDGGVIIQRNDNGEPEGWVAKRWNVQVQERFGLFLAALGEEFDDKAEGINLQETAIGVSQEYDPSFSPELYSKSVKVNMLALKKAFPLSTTMQYANFMPGEWLPWENHGYLNSIYEYGEEIGVGLGGPDLMVQRKGQLNHALAMMHEGEFSVPLGVAIQDGNYVGMTGADQDYDEHEEIGVSDHNNIVPLLHAFAIDFLRVKYMFWVDQEPYFNTDVMPCFTQE